jgi:hypothetical protein
MGADNLIPVQTFIRMKANRKPQTPGRVPLTSIRDDARDRQRAYLAGVLKANPGLTITDIARESGLSPSTLTRVFNDPDSTTVLSGPVMAAIEARFGAAGDPPVQGELEALDPAQAGFDDVDPKLLRFRIGAGFSALPAYRPGDVLFVDEALLPRDRDDVVIVIDDLKGGASLHLRHFKRSWAFGDATIEPEFVDGVRVRIIGVVRESRRIRL